MGWNYLSYRNLYRIQKCFFWVVVAFFLDNTENPCLLKVTNYFSGLTLTVSNSNSGIFNSCCLFFVFFNCFFFVNNWFHGATFFFNKTKKQRQSWFFSTNAVDAVFLCFLILENTKIWRYPP